MTLQQNFLELENLFNKYELPKKDLEKDIEQMGNFKVTTPIIGGFSTGKSSMINAFLGERLLKTKLTPETAVPAEISYGEPYVKVVKGEKYHSITFDDLLNEEFSIDDTDYIQIQFLNDVLSQLPTVKLVDMPGFDSGIEAHNTAINQYLPNSLAYILTFAADEPVVKESIANFLKELKLFDVPVYVCITKADKVPEEELEKIFDSLRVSIEKLLGVAPKKVVAIWSKRNKNTEGLKAILKDIEASSQEIFHKKYTALQKYYARTVEQYIVEMLKGMELSVSELDEKEAKLIKDLESIKTKIEQEQQRFEKQLSKSITTIQTKIEHELYTNKEDLITQLVRGGDIQYKLNIMLRTAITAAIKEEFEPKLRQHIQNLTKSIQLDVPIDASVQLDELKIEAENLMKELTIKALPLILAALGVLITGPLRGTLLGLVTLVTELFFKKKRENELRAEAEQKLTTKIIPFVVQEAGALIEKELQQYTGTVHEAVQEEVSKQRDVLQKALQDIREQKQQEESQREQLKQQLNNDLQRVKELQYDAVVAI